jgi:hypothetical protein
MFFRKNEGWRKILVGAENGVADDELWDRTGTRKMPRPGPQTAFRILNRGNALIYCLNHSIVHVPLSFYVRAASKLYASLAIAKALHLTSTCELCGSNDFALKGVLPEEPPNTNKPPA